MIIAHGCTINFNILSGIYYMLLVLYVEPINRVEPRNFINVCESLNSKFVSGRGGGAYRMAGNFYLFYPVLSWMRFLSHNILEHMVIFTTWVEFILQNIFAMQGPG